MIPLSLICFLLLATLGGAVPTDPPVLLCVDEPMSGEVVSSDPIIETPTLARDYWDVRIRAKAYRIRVEESGLYTIDVRSLYFDSYLVLKGSENDVLAEDDDGYYGVHARLASCDLEAGRTYVLSVCALRDATGSFDLTLTAGSPEPLSPDWKRRQGVKDLRRGLALIEVERGLDHLDTAVCLDNLAGQLVGHGQLGQAQKLQERALAIREKSLGPDDPIVASSLNNLAVQFSFQGRYDEAQVFHERALKIREKVYGEDHRATAKSLNNLGSMFLVKGDLNESQPYLERALTIREKILGPDHPRTSESLGNLGALMRAKNSFVAARKYYERALRIDEKVRGADHPNTMGVMLNVAELLHVEGDFAAAEVLFERLLVSLEREFGPTHSLTIKALNNFAALLRDQGLYERARGHYERALSVRERVLGPDHPETARILNSLGLLLCSQGNDEESRIYFERALSIRERKLGPTHLETAKSLNNLAIFFGSQGLYDEAYPLFVRSLEIKKNRLSSVHEAVALGMANLARVLQMMGRFEEGADLLESAGSIYEKRFGAEDFRTLSILQGLARLRDNQGRQGEAQELYKRVLLSRERTLGSDHPATAKSLNDLGVSLMEEGRYLEAAPYIQKAFRIRKKALGSGHFDTVRALGSLALLEANLGRLDAALETSREAFSSAELQMQRVRYALSENERLRHAAKSRETLEILLSLEPLTKGNEQAHVYEAILSWKGRVSRSMLSVKPAAMGELSSTQRVTAAALRGVEKRIADEVYRDPVLDRKNYEETLESLRLKRNGLELDLLRSMDQKKRATDTARLSAPTVESLCACLPAGAVVIDFFVHRLYRPAAKQEDGSLVAGEWQPAQLSAWVLRAGSPGVVRVDLGQASRLYTATADFLGSLRSRRGVAVVGEGKKPELPENSLLFKLLWGPLISLIGEADLVIVSPDGFLGALPFETLRMANGTYLLERHGFVYLQDMANLSSLLSASKPKMAPSLLVAGGIDYRRTNDAVIKDVSPDSTRGSFRSTWHPLSATLEEADAVASLFEEGFEKGANKVLLTRKNATEERVKLELPRSRYVHLATHGYFQPEGLPVHWTPRLDEESKQGGLDINMAGRITGLFPGLLSGLVLAGANEARDPSRENGLLTAEELIRLDLSECELVVLSACETGLGRALSGEGMIGLRRSFRQAGVRTVVSSLWSVMDEATSRLMAVFYENLWLKKMGKLEALRSAQLQMLERNRMEYGSGIPLSWGAFILDGDWR